MGKLTFTMRATEPALPDETGETSAMVWAFVLIFALSAVVFSAVWLIATFLAAPSV